MKLATQLHLVLKKSLGFVSIPPTSLKCGYDRGLRMRYFIGIKILYIYKEVRKRNILLPAQLEDRLDTTS
jgi:hypothetical protein